MGDIKPWDPYLEVVIAMGGRTFGDPGLDRTTLIRNLLGFFLDMGMLELVGDLERKIYRFW